MTTARHRRGDAPRTALRWTRAAVVALVAALAVLVHHEAAAPLMHMPSAPVVEAAGMDGADGHAPLPRAAAPCAACDDGACSGQAMQHCSTANVDTVKLVPPAEPAVDHVPAAPSRATAGRDVPGTTSRAPPDLSLLSRLLL